MGIMKKSRINKYNFTNNLFNSCSYTRTDPEIISNVNISVNNIIGVLEEINIILGTTRFGQFANAGLARCFSEEFLQKANRITGTQSYSQAAAQCECGIYDD